MEGLPSGTEHTEVSEQLPDALERRLVLRLLTYWRSIRGERDFPSFAEIEPSEISDIWAHCIVLEFVNGQDNPVFRVVGEGLSSHTKGLLPGHRVSDIAQNTLLCAAVSYFDEILEKCAPVCRGDRLDGTALLYRSIILPMSDDGEMISGLLVALTYGNFQDGYGQ